MTYASIAPDGGAVIIAGCKTDPRKGNGETAAPDRESSALPLILTLAAPPSVAPKRVTSLEPRKPFILRRPIGR